MIEQTFPCVISVRGKGTRIWVIGCVERNGTLTPVAISKTGPEHEQEVIQRIRIDVTDCAAAPDADFVQHKRANTAGVMRRAGVVLPSLVEAQR